VGTLLNLILNENMKIYRRPRTWMLVVLMLGFLLIHMFTTHNVMKDAPVNANWKQELVKENEEMKKRINENPQAPQSFRDRMEANMKKNEYYIENDVSPQGLNVWSYMNNGADLLIIATVFTVVIAGDVVSSEFSGGTIKMLLIRPVSRTKILLSKYASVLLFLGFMVLALFVPMYLLGGLLFGFSGADLPYIYVSPYDDAIYQMSQSKHLLIQLGLGMIPNVVMVTMAFMISAAMRSTALSIAISLTGLFVGINLVNFFQEYVWAKYILFAHMNLAQYIEGPIRFADTSMTFSLIMLGVYFVVFQLVAWILFSKRDVAA
jgi:ABC-2 type transport system permease protein